MTGEVQQVLDKATATVSEKGWWLRRWSVSDPCLASNTQRLKARQIRRPKDQLSPVEKSKRELEIPNGNMLGKDSAFAGNAAVVEEAGPKLVLGQLIGAQISGGNIRRCRGT